MPNNSKCPGGRIPPGNPLTYYNGTSWTFTWEHGRQLATMTSGSTTWTNTYNSDGLRTSRTDGTTSYTYYYEGGRLSAIKRDDLNMWIIYDENGPVTLKYGVGTFHYVTNPQGDVVTIVGNQGQTLVEYTYDAWGKVTSITGDYAYNLGIHNPILYRGYIYDHETGLYYCQSRYYDPEIGRWLNADAFTSTGQGMLGNNMFAYCGNNPVVRSDSSGGFWLVSLGVGLATQYIGDVIGNLLDGKTGIDVFEPTSSVGEYIAAGVTALIPGTGLGGALVRNVVAEGITIIEDVFSGNEVSFVDSMVSIGVGMLFDTGFEKISGNITDFMSSQMPQNYSSFAHAVRQSNPNLTKEQVYRIMRCSIGFNRVVSETVSFGLDIINTCLQ